MKNLHVAALATLFGISAASGILVTQAQHPGNDSGLLAATASIASADQGDRGDRGNGRGNRGNRNNNNGNWQFQNGQCNTNGNVRRGDNDNDNDDNDADDRGQNQNNQGNQGNPGDRHGRKRGWQNPRNPHYCGNNGNCINGQFGGQYGQYGQYGQNAQSNCNPNGGNRQGNAVIRGTITAVNGNQVTLMEGFGQSITINDQPALDNQQSGRVVPGRFVTAYGYYQNGIFYATSMQ